VANAAGEISWEEYHERYGLEAPDVFFCRSLVLMTITKQRRVS
jgi:hypothetical protein